MTIRRLKITVSAVSIAACALLLIFWVRSHWVCEALIWNGGRRITVGSAFGQIRLLESHTTNPSEPLLKWQLSGFMPDGIGPWYFQTNPQGIILAIPYRFPITVLILLAAAPWIHWRYSLRSMLIATAVVALLLVIWFYPH